MQTHGKELKAKHGLCLYLIISGNRLAMEPRKNDQEPMHHSQGGRYTPQKSQSRDLSVSADENSDLHFQQTRYQYKSSPYSAYSGRFLEEADGSVSRAASFQQSPSYNACSARRYSGGDSEVPSLQYSETSSLGTSLAEENDWHRSNQVCSGESSQKSIEIAPGEFLTLRGANETWQSIQNDEFMPASCSCCHETIFCIQDAGFVLCPFCRVVSPMHGNSPDAGVGLGFCMEDLAKWQEQIRNEQRRCS